MPMSDETKARYSELLIALEQAISQAAERADTPQDVPGSAASEKSERDAARLQSEAPRHNRLPPAISPFAPPNTRPLRPERPLAEPRPLEPAAIPDRLPAFVYDERRRRQEAILGLKPDTLPRPPQAWQLEFEAGPPSRWGLLRRNALAGVAAAAIGLLSALYLSEAVHTPNVASASVPPAPQRALNGGRDRQPTAQVAPRMVLTDLSGPKNRPIALGVTVEAPPHGASVVVKGMPSGSRLTGGAAVGEGSWRIPMRDMARAAVIPPPDYVGAMHLAVDLRLADDTVADSDVLRLEWTSAVAEGVVPKPVKTTTIAAGGNPKPPPPAAPAPATTDLSGGAMAALALARPQAVQPDRQEARPISAPPTPVAPAPVPLASVPPASVPAVRSLDRDEIATLVERGQGFLQNGDIAAARLLLRRAANAGHAPAAMALAATYDPATLKELGVLGVVPNVDTARVWYEKASQLGSAEAVRRLQRLAQQQQQQ